MGRSFGDRADGSNKIRQLKKELEKLKKENASLRKALDKALQFLQNKKTDEEIEETEKKSKKKKSKQSNQSCEICGKGKYKYWAMERPDGKKLVTLTCDNEACSHQKRTIN